MSLILWFLILIYYIQIKNENFNIFKLRDITIDYE
jgi:hypothetical protein